MFNLTHRGDSRLPLMTLSDHTHVHLVAHPTTNSPSFISQNSTSHTPGKPHHSLHMQSLIYKCILCFSRSDPKIDTFTLGPLTQMHLRWGSPVQGMPIQVLPQFHPSTFTSLSIRFIHLQVFPFPFQSRWFTWLHYLSNVHVDPYRATETEVLWNNYVNTMAAYSMTLCVTSHFFYLGSLLKFT